MSQQLYAAALVSLILAGGAEAQVCRSELARSTPDNRFTLQSGGGELVDKRTQLVWQRCNLGQTWNGTGCEGEMKKYLWKDALQAARTLGSGWRLPDVKELQSLVEEACVEPAVNAAMFPGTVSDWYWTSSPVANIPNYAWVVNFKDGQSYGVGKSLGGQAVRLVRNGS